MKILLILVFLFLGANHEIKKSVKFHKVTWDNSYVNDGMKSFWKEIEDSLSNDWELIGDYKFDYEDYEFSGTRHAWASQMIMKTEYKTMCCNVCVKIKKNKVWYICSKCKKICKLKR